MKKKILAFGYIPKAKGGKQQTGLATGIFDLHDAVNSLNSDYSLIIAATDIHQEEIKIDSTLVFGWTMKILIRHVASNPIKILFFIYQSLILSFKFRGIVKFLDTVAKLMFLDYSIERSKCELVHFHGSTGAILSKGLWNKRQRFLLRLHGINGDNKTISHFKTHARLEKYITSLEFEKVTFVSSYNIDQWIERYGRFSCGMIPILNGYNPKIFYPSSKNSGKKYDLITISGVSENKGQIRVLQALQRLSSEGIKLHYLVIGSIDIRYKETIDRTIGANGSNITFVDYVSQAKLNTYLQNAKYFILPSIAEGFGKAFIESIGAGTPVIIPSHLPLAREENLLDPTNSFIIEDSSSDSIYNGLKVVFGEERFEYSRDIVSRTVNHLQWNNIARSYVDLYHSMDNLKIKE